MRTGRWQAAKADHSRRVIHSGPGEPVSARPTTAKRFLHGAVFRGGDKVEADQHPLRVGKNRRQRKEGWFREGAAIAARPVAGFPERSQSNRSATGT